MSGRAITQNCPRCQLAVVVPETFLGTNVVCAGCRTEFKITGATEADENLAATTLLPPMAVAVAPHIEGRWKRDASVPDAPNPIDEAGEEESYDAPRSTSWWALGCMMMVSVTVVIAAAALGIPYAMNRFASKAAPIELDELVVDEKPDLDAGFTATNPGGKWNDASKHAITREEILVRIDEVEIGAALHVADGEYLQTPDNDYLIIRFVVKNKRISKEVKYQSWYSYKFEEDGQEISAEVIDEAGNKLNLYPIAGSEKIERHTVSDILLEPGEETVDSLVYKLSDDYADERPRDLRLSLPGAAVGQEGFYQFLIPSSMIKRR